MFLNELTGLYSRVMTERVSIRHCVVMPRGGRWDRAQGMVKEVRARMSQCLAELGEGVDKEDMHWKLVNPTCLFAICGCGMTWSQLTILSGVPLEVLAFLKQWGEGLVGVMRLLRSYLSRGGNAHLLLLTWEELRDRIGGAEFYLSGDCTVVL